MTEEELANWQRIKEHFDSLPEFKRDNYFYKRAIAITSGQPDPQELPSLETEDKSDES
tara:strand:+ start:9070 stop:9243 length:174 start_codon:yes stop_codon:yes gene_type:complete